jgi:hypothetical protein
MCVPVGLDADSGAIKFLGDDPGDACAGDGYVA